MKTTVPFALLSIAAVSHAYLPVPMKNTTSAPSPPQRKDIDTLTTQEFNLLVLAMQKWQQAPAGNVGGYFQVAGIHGAPHVYWDNAGGFQTSNAGDSDVGYCPHSDQNFYLWHRPYVTLFEQQLRATVVSIANTWYQPQRAAYQAAANTFRLPYWDWAKSSQPGTVPSYFANTQIQVVNSTTGQAMTIKNPLYSYTLVQGGNLGSYSDGSTISVGPGRTTNRKSNYQTAMQNQGPTLQKNIALLFNTPNVCWNVFATYNSDEWQQCSGNTNVPSLESTHNTVHNTIGGSMQDLDISAFDPIFWFHHCMVDRVGALWQAINPNTFVQPTYSEIYTFVDNSGTEGPTWPYLPFRYTNGNTAWWQPNMLYDVRATGYTYPEIADLPSPSTVLSRVNAIYGTGRTQQAISKSSRRRRRVEGRVAQRAASASISSLTIPPSTAALTPFASLLINRNGSFHEYSVQCTIQQGVAPGASFMLHLFFGDVVIGSDYLAAPNRVGGFSVSQAGSNTKMNHTVSSVVDITDGLLNMLILGNVRDMRPATIRQYVRSKLVWRLVTATGQDIGGSRGLANGLSIKVLHSLVTPQAAANALPIISPVDQIAETTDNTAAAALPADVAATTLTSTASAAAATGVGPVPLSS